MSITSRNKPLYVKSYFSSSVEEALAQARQELGPDALLLNSREAPPEARYLGQYEVVFGGNTEMEALTAKTEVDAVADLRLRMEELREMVTRIGQAPSERAGEYRVVEETLVAAGVGVELAREIDEAVRLRAARQSVLPIRTRAAVEPVPGFLMRETVAVLEERFEVAPELGRVAALIGPPGSGKTSALIKLAVTRGLMAGRPVHLLSIDNYRIAAADQLRTYAAILGVTFQSVETTAGLAGAIDIAPRESLVLIDTPGYSVSALSESGGELAAFLSRRQDIDTHLVLTASMRSSDMQRLADGFEAFRPSRLIFSKVDETDAYGSMFCEAARRQRPISFFCAGQAIPEDLQAASKAYITDSLVRELPQRLRAVA